jgi:hypothetical protein
VVAAAAAEAGEAAEREAAAQAQAERAATLEVCAGWGGVDPLARRACVVACTATQWVTGSWWCGCRRSADC